MKSKLLTNITFRLDPDISKRLDALAEDSVGRSKLIRLALAEKLPDWERNGVRFGKPTRTRACPPPSGN